MLGLRISRNNVQCAAVCGAAGVQQVQGGNLQTEDDGSRISSDTVTATTTSPGHQHTGPWVCVLALIVKCDWKLSDRSSSLGPGTYGAPCSMDQPGQDNRHSWGKISRFE